MTEAIDQARESLLRIQQFDPNSLRRSEELGTSLSFNDAPAVAKSIIEVAKRLPAEVLDDLVPSQYSDIQRSCDNIYSIFSQIIEFDPSKTDNPSTTRDQITSTLNQQYEPFFQSLFLYIAYGISQKTDFSRIERDARAQLQEIRDESDLVQQKLAQHEIDAARILDDVREVASQQGVTQQAIYFRNEAEHHKSSSKKWYNYLLWSAGGLAAFSALSIFLHKIPYLEPTDTFSATQLVVSKILIFTVIAYLVILCARNFTAHQHNEIVNRHRQNALLTFESLVDAAQAENARDIVLNHAASSIFNPQDSGYARSQSSTNNGGIISASMIDLIGRGTSRNPD